MAFFFAKNHISPNIPIIIAFLFLLSIFSSGIEDGENELFAGILRDEAVARIKELGKVSDADNYLERTFISPASLIASKLIRTWMEEAGLNTWVDQMGNIHGRSQAVNSTAEILLIGSHLDTVIDAGMYDGTLGVICAIAAVKALKLSGNLEKLYRPIEVIAFSDEEGVKFQTTFLGSGSIAGIFPKSILQISDKSGIKVQDVLRGNSFQGTDESLLQVKYQPESVWKYIEVMVSGCQGHAGTVPMYMRRDPMAASSELILSLESICKNPLNFLNYDEQCGSFTKESLVGLVCTVGEISCWPSASNVIPGQVNFTVDIRAVDDIAREAIISEYSSRVNKICEERMVNCTIEHKHNAEAAKCDPELSLQLKDAANSALNQMKTNVHGDVPVLMSGAGHDAMAMSHITKVGMLFVRCRGGISHSPDEYVLDDDVWTAGLTLFEYLKTNLISSDI